MATSSAKLFHSSGTALIRVSTDPGDLPATADLDPHDHANSLEWLRTAWSNPALIDAVTQASTVLAAQVEAALATDGPGKAKDIVSLARSVASYLLRWTGRATPFGLFAGVAPVQVGPCTKVARDGAHRPVAKADSRWLDGVVASVEQHPELIGRLTVVANNTATVRGGRLILLAGPGGSTRQPAAREVSLRATGVVRAALSAAAKPISYDALMTSLSEQFPAADPGQISTLLTELANVGALLTSIRPGGTETDPLGHLLQQLNEHGSNLPPLDPLHVALRDIHTDLARHNHPDETYDAASFRRAVAGRMRELRYLGSPLAVDVRAGYDLVLPEVVFVEVEAAADLLIRVSPHPFGHPAWRQFHARFRSRYGPGAHVPLFDLLSDAGLGFPAGYAGSPLGKAAAPQTKRDVALLTLAQRAAVDRRREVTLSATDVGALTVGDHAEAAAPSRVELAFTLYAPDVEAIDRGRFRIAVVAAPRPGASMIGRFLHILESGEADRLAETFSAASGALAAQLSFPPRRTRSLNVTRTQAVLPDVISIAEHPDPGLSTITLDDLAVGADARHMYLVQVSTGRVIEPRVTHALEAGTNTPPLARFLAEISTARSAAYGVFDWGAAATLPYLPRLVSGRVVLSTARWQLTSADMPGRAATSEQWDKALSEWRARWDAPAVLVLVEGELRLPLDLDQRISRTLLRAQLEHAGRAELREGSSEEEVAWIGRPHEIVVPMRRRAADDVPDSRRRASLRLVDPADTRLPGGSDYLCAHVYAHPDRIDELLTAHLPELWKSIRGIAPRFWYDRYRDSARPDTPQQLRLYVRLSSAQAYNDAAGCIATFASTRSAARLISHLELATYTPQYGRYGSTQLMDAAETVFTADSHAALAQITTVRESGTPAQAICATASLGIVTALTGDLQWLIDEIHHETGRIDPATRDTTFLLTDGKHGREHVAELPGGAALLAAWEARDAALAAYQLALNASDEDVRPTRSLLHAQHVRALGVDHESERTVLRLARAAAQRRRYTADRHG